MSQLLTAGERGGVWEKLGDLAKRVGILEAVKSATPTPPGTLVAVWGALYNDANIIAGTGFTASWDNNGAAPTNLNYYTIYFDTPFTNPPVVLLAPNNNNPASIAGRYTATLLTRQVGYIVVITEDVDDPDSLTAQDGGFDFICIEPGV